MTYTWPLVVQFFVPGIPKPGGSKTAFYNKLLGRALIVDACKGNKQWRATVAIYAVEAYHGPPLDGPLMFEMTFFFPRPKNHFGTGRNAGILKASARIFPTVKPDLTKVIRSTEDACTGILWADDASVIDQLPHKRYAGGPYLGVEPSKIPGVRITLRRLQKENR